MRRSAVLGFACLLAICGHPPRADSEPSAPRSARTSAELLRLLRSHDPAEAAWGAYLAGVQREAEAVPLLLAQLRTQAGAASERPSFPLQAALIDALVLLDPAIEPDVLLPHAEGLLLPGVVVFLARHPERYGRACLALFERLRADDLAWLALGNAMARVGTAGFAASLLRGLELRLSVRVWTYVPRGRFQAPHGSVPGCGFLRFPEGLPPIVVYRLSTDAGHGGALLAGGLRSVYAVRQENEDRELGFGTSGVPDVDGDACRLEWLGGWGALPPALRESTEIDLRWTGEQPFLRTVVERRDALVDAWRASVSRLLAARRLTPYEVSILAPGVRIDVSDYRTWKRGDLPPIPALPTPVDWLRPSPAVRAR